MSTSRKLAEQVEQLGKTIAAGNARRAARQGTTPARAKLLQLLAKRGASKMSDLGHELQVTPRNVTKLVDGLEQQGLVIRAAHPRDRRATLVQATATGLQVAKQYEAGTAYLEAALGHFSPAEQATFQQLLEKLQRSLGTGDR